MSDLLDLAIKARDDADARWEFAQHPTIMRLLRREIRRHAKRSEREDALAQAQVEVVEVMSRGLEFSTEGELVSYWDMRSKGVVEKGLRALGGCRFKDGRLVRREFASSEVATSPIIEERDSSMRIEADRIIARAESLASRHHCRASLCVMLRASGRGWDEVAREVGLEDISVAKRLHGAFVARARNELIEEGERVVVKILGIKVDEFRVSLVLLEEGRIIDGDTIEVEDLTGVRVAEERVRRFLDRSPHQIVIDDGPVSDLGMLVRVACLKKEIEPEYFDLSLLVRGVDPLFFDGLAGMDDGRRMAYLLARAKEAENKLKYQRY